MGTRVSVDVVAGRRTIVTALPLKKAARERLAELLQARVVDVRTPVDHADLVLTPACSPQLIGRLRAQYEHARIVVVELDDWDLDIELPGPVKRLLRNGADAYLLADSLDELATKIAAPSAAAADDSRPPHELPATATVDELIDAFLRESIEYAARRNGR
jgi:hypothetical protein